MPERPKKPRRACRCPLSRSLPGTPPPSRAPRVVAAGRLMLVSFLIMLPVVPYLLFGKYPLFIVLPYIASLDIMLGAIEPLSAWRLTIDVILLFAWGYLAYRYSINQVNKYLVYK